MKIKSNVLSAKGLHKIYGKRSVVKEVDLELCKGEIVGLLGPNGAGKTTSIRMIMGIIKPDAGTITLNDYDINAIEEEHNNFFNSIKNKTKPDVCFNSGLEALKVAFLILNDMKND